MRLNLLNVAVNQFFKVLQASRSSLLVRSLLSALALSRALVPTGWPDDYPLRGRSSLYHQGFYSGQWDISFTFTVMTFLTRETRTEKGSLILNRYMVSSSAVIVQGLKDQRDSDDSQEMAFDTWRHFTTLPYHDMIESVTLYNEDTRLINTEEYPIWNYQSRLPLSFT